MKKIYTRAAAIVLLTLQTAWMASAQPNFTPNSPDQPSTCAGNVTLGSQADVDAFPTTYGCAEIAGRLIISGSDIVNLNGLHSLTRLAGSLVIMDNPLLVSVAGLSSLTFVGISNDDSIYAGVQIANNGSLGNLDGLNALTEIQGMLRIYNNSKLANIEGLASLSLVGVSQGPAYSVSIVNNPGLVTVSGLKSLTAIPGEFEISGNAALRNLDGLRITDVTGFNAVLIIAGNNSLTSINGLSSLTKVHGRSALLAINDNPLLVNLNGLNSLTEIYGAPGGAALQIKNNASLVNVDELATLTSIDFAATLTVTNNSHLTRGCGLFPLLSAWDYARPQVIDISGNGPGVTKEGILSGACPKVCNGDIALTTQAAVDAFPSTYACGEIAGTITISGNDITNLDGLHSLTRVDGSLVITDNPNLTSVAGLSSLSYVGYGNELGNYPGFQVADNANLINLDGLSALTEIQGMLRIYNNTKLANIEGLASLRSVGSTREVDYSVSILQNRALVSVAGLRSLTFIPGQFDISGNTALLNLNGLHITEITGDFAALLIVANTSLTNISGLSSLTSLHGKNALIAIEYNPRLINLSGLNSITSIRSLPDGGGALQITNNASLVDVDALTALTSIPFNVNIAVTNNPVLTRGCGLYPLLSAEHSDQNYGVDISSNGAGVTLEEILAGGPCRANCAQPPLDKYVFAESAKGPAPHATNIIVRDYEPGILYELLKNSDSSHVAGPYTGNIGLYVQNLTTTTQYYVIGRNPDTNCETIMSTRPVVTITTIPDFVDCATITILDKNMIAEQDTLAQGQATNIIVFNGNEGIEYQLRNNEDDSYVAGPFPSSIGLYSSALFTTTTFNVLAIDQATQCSKQMSTLVTITISEPAQQFSVYPNPNAGEFAVEATDDLSGPCHFTIYDFVGNVVKTEQLNKETGVFKSSLDLRSIPRGVYVISFYRSDGSVKNKRLVIRD